MPIALMPAIGKALLVITVFEVSIGGGGRLVDTGAISPRMVLFGLALCYTAAMLIRGEKLPRHFGWLIALFTVLSCLSGLRAIAEGHITADALADFKPLAYFFLLPFFVLTIRTVSDVLLINRILMISALALAASYLLVMSIWKSELLTTDDMMGWLNPEHDGRLEFYFRGDATFYFKAVLYLGVGVFFFASEGRLSGRFVAALLALALGLTMTRGIWAALFVILAAWIFLSSRRRLVGAVKAIGLLFIGFAGTVWITLNRPPSTALSDAQRARDVASLMSPEGGLDWMALLYGHGFGAAILGRQAIEIAYANVLHKQGVVGLFFWLWPLAYVAWGVRAMSQPGQRPLAMPYLLATIFVYLVSVTNPFLTNPIGMATVMIAMVAVTVIRRSQEPILSAASALEWPSTLKESRLWIAMKRRGRA